MKDYAIDVTLQASEQEAVHLVMPLHEDFV
jgi:hypothetical protein